MRKIRLFVLAAMLAVPIVGASAAPAHACTSQFEPDGCAVINNICIKVFKGACLG